MLVKSQPKKQSLKRQWDLEKTPTWRIDFLVSVKLIWRYSLLEDPDAKLNKVKAELGRKQLTVGIHNLKTHLHLSSESDSQETTPTFGSVFV